MQSGTLVSKKFFWTLSDDLRNQCTEEVFLFRTRYDSYLCLDPTRGVLVHAKLGTPHVAYLSLNNAVTTQDADQEEHADLHKDHFNAAELKQIPVAGQNNMVHLVTPCGTLISNEDGSNQYGPLNAAGDTYTTVPASFIAKIMAWNGRWLQRSSHRILNLRSLESLDLAVQIYQEHRATLKNIIDFSAWPPTQRSLSGQSAYFSEDIVPFRPLIYYCIYSRYELLEPLALSLDCLDRYGHYDGTIGIVTDFAESVIRKHVPSRYQDSLRIFPMPRGSHWLSRYSVDLSAFETFQPILYLDCDVVCAQPIDDLLIDVANADKICIATEWKEYRDKPLNPLEWGDYGDWFGRFLFRESSYSGTAAFGNSGIIGIPHVRLAQEVFPAVLNLIQHPAVPLQFGDQPFLNYVLHATATGNFTLINQHAQLVRNALRVSLEGPHTLIHVLNALRRSDRTAELRAALSHCFLQKICTATHR